MTQPEDDISCFPDEPVNRLLQLVEGVKHLPTEYNEVGRWFSDGVNHSMTTHISLDDALGLRDNNKKQGSSSSKAKRYWLKERDKELLQALKCIAVEYDRSDCAVLALKITNFKNETWPAIRDRESLDSYWSDLDRHLFNAFKISDAYCKSSMPETDLGLWNRLQPTIGYQSNDTNKQKDVCDSFLYGKR